MFRKDGTFVSEFFVDRRRTLGRLGLGPRLLPDPKQTSCSRRRREQQSALLRRSDGEVVGSFGRNGRKAGEFHWVHNIAIDSKGNVYTAEVDTGKRVQKFKPTNGAPK